MLQGVVMHTADILALPARKLDILRQIERWKSGLITQIEASNLLRLSERYFRRLIRRYESHGPKVFFMEDMVRAQVTNWTRLFGNEACP